MQLERWTKHQVRSIVDEKYIVVGYFNATSLLLLIRTSPLGSRTYTGVAPITNLDLPPNCKILYEIVCSFIHPLARFSFVWAGIVEEFLDVLD